MALEQDIANLIDASNKLTNIVDNKAQLLDQKAKSLDQKEKELDAQMAALTASASAKVDKFIQDARPETRHVQDIFIGGSKDLLYPVWWLMPSNGSGTSKITVARQYHWNADTKPYNSSSPHQAALLLEMEGNASPWSGDANFLHIKRFHERYNNTASHVSFVMNCFAEKVDPSKALYGGGDDGKLGAYCRNRSGMYLRGGGVKYRIINNWGGNVKHMDGSTNERVVLYTYTGEESTARWFVKPIPFTERKAPIATVLPYANNHYTPPATA